MKPTNLRVCRRANVKRWVLLFDFNNVPRKIELRTHWQEMPTGKDVCIACKGLDLSVEECLSIPMEI